MRQQSSVPNRAIGTRNFIATCAVIAPLRTCCCTGAGSNSTRLIRRETQLTLRSKRRANSSCS
jgi:hypothetical protein